MLYCGNILITGKTNTGKSSLINILVNKKINIVSKKINTTNQIVNSLYNDIDTQYIYTDTPGCIFFNKFKSNIIFNSDVILFLITVNNNNINIDFKKNFITNKVLILIINKIDLLKNKYSLFSVIEKFKNLNIFNEIIPVSCYTKCNINKLKNVIKLYLPKKKFFYKENFFINKNLNFIYSEFLREKIFQLTNKEIPYETKIFTENIIFNKYFKKIFFKILVNKISHKLIILGKNGKKIKKIIKETKYNIKKFDSDNNNLYIDINICINKIN